MSQSLITGKDVSWVLLSRIFPQVVQQQVFQPPKFMFCKSCQDTGACLFAGIINEWKQFLCVLGVPLNQFIDRFSAHLDRGMFTHLEKNFIDPVSLQTIQYALASIVADSLNPRTIHLLPGTYSPETNGEIFPIDVISYVSVVGESADSVILDAESTAGVVRFDHSQESGLMDATLIGGNTELGGGVHCTNSTVDLTNLVVTDNTAVTDGGGVYCEGGTLSIATSVAPGTE